ncbi:unnamed protein product [Phytomonas sp. EM1]|nr:unnamed protein product [Phytomonas sp. EM1]|eukprot:CCW60582.1 unnamed protein product [Phytomonas sp. isolate EM1]
MNLGFPLSESRVEGPLLHRGSCQVLQQVVLVHACHVILALRCLSDSDLAASPFTQEEEALTSSPADTRQEPLLQSRLFGRRHRQGLFVNDEEAAGPADPSKGSSLSKEDGLGLVSGLTSARSGGMATLSSRHLEERVSPFPSSASARDYLRSAPLYGILTAAHLLRCTAYPFQRCDHEKGALAARLARVVRSDVAWCAGALAQLSQWILREWKGEINDEANDGDLHHASGSIGDLLRCALDVSPEVHTVGSITPKGDERETGARHGERVVFVSELLLQVFPEVGYAALRNETTWSREAALTGKPTEVDFDVACGCPHRWMREALPRWLLCVSLMEHARVWGETTLLKKSFYHWRLRRGFGVLRKLLAGGYNGVETGEESQAIPNSSGEMLISSPSPYPLDNQPTQRASALTMVRSKGEQVAMVWDGVERAGLPNADEKESTVDTDDAPSSIANRSIPSLPSAFASLPVTRQPSAEAAASAPSPGVDDPPEGRVVRDATKIDRPLPSSKIEDGDKESDDLDSGLQGTKDRERTGRQGQSALLDDDFYRESTIHNGADNSQYEARIPAATCLFPEDHTPSTAKPSPGKNSDGISMPHLQTPSPPPDNLVESNCTGTFLTQVIPDPPLNRVSNGVKDPKCLETFSNSPSLPSSPTESLLMCFSKSSSLRRVRYLFLRWRDDRYYTTVALRYVQTLCCEHTREAAFRHWLKRLKAHFRSRKELEDQQRCAQVLETKAHEVLRGVLRRWRDLALVAQFSMQTIGRRVFRRWRLVVVCFAYGRRNVHTGVGSFLDVENHEQGWGLKGVWNRWRARFLLEHALRWHRQREQLKTLLRLMLRAKQQRCHQSLLLRYNKRLKASVFRKWCDRFEKQIRLSAFSLNYTRRQVQETFERWKMQYTLRGTATKRGVALQRRHEDRRLERDFFFWKKRLALRRRLHEVQKQGCLGRGTLIQTAWDRWAGRTRYRLAWWQGQGEIAEGFHLNALARGSLRHWARRLTSHRQALEANTHSRMENRSDNHYALHLSAKTFFRWKTKAWLISRLNVDARRRLPRAALQQPAVLKNVPTESRRDLFVQTKKRESSEQRNTLTPSARSVGSSSLNSERLKKVHEVRKAEKQVLAPRASATSASRVGHPPRKKAPPKVRSNASEALPRAKNGFNRAVSSSTHVLRPSPSSATISITSEAVGLTRASLQRDTAALGKNPPDSPQNHTAYLTSTSSTEPFHPSPKDTKLVFIPSLHKRSLLAERQLLSFVRKNSSSFSIFTKLSRAWISRTACASRGDIVQTLSLPNNPIDKRGAAAFDPVDTPFPPRQRGSWDLCLSASKYYSLLLNGDDASQGGESRSRDGILSGEWKRGHSTLAARDEGLNVSQESPR